MVCHQAETNTKKKVSFCAKFSITNSHQTSEVQVEVGQVARSDAMFEEYSSATETPKLISPFSGINFRMNFGYGI
jgi:hypothetical protein